MTGLFATGVLGPILIPGDPAVRLCSRRRHEENTGRRGKTAGEMPMRLRNAGLVSTNPRRSGLFFAFAGYGPVPSLS